jgi:bacterioferritin
MERGRIGSCTPEAVLTLLDDALATENLCVLRHKRQSQLADGVREPAIAGELRKLVNRERAHAERIAARIVQLGGEPNFSPEGLSDRSHAEYVEGSSLVNMIREDLVAERVAIDSYSQMIRFIGERDPSTRVMLERILAAEEEHAEDLATLLVTLDPTKEGS